MKIIKVQLEGFCGPTVYPYNPDGINSAVEEVRILFDEFVEGQVVTVVQATMPDDEFNNLEDFGGY